MVAGDITMSMELDEADIQLLLINNIPQYIIDVIATMVYDAWHEGFNAGESEYCS